MFASHLLQRRPASSSPHGMHLRRRRRSGDVQLERQLRQIAECAAGGQALVEIGFDNACGEDASYFAKYSCCPGGEPPPPPPPCFGELIGDPVTCSDNEQLGQKAWYGCDSAGAAMTSLTFGDECGEKSSHYAKIECCFPPPPPPPGQCFGDWLGDPSTCVPNEVLQDQAAAVCESQAAKLTDIGFDGACGPAASNTAKFSCCSDPTPPPPPPPPVCNPGAFQSKDCVENNVLASQAKELCASQSATVEGLAFDGACGPKMSAPTHAPITEP
jgi:hypothetical protein